MDIPANPVRPVDYGLRIHGDRPANRGNDDIPEISPSGGGSGPVDVTTLSDEALSVLAGSDAEKSIKNADKSPAHKARAYLLDHDIEGLQSFGQLVSHLARGGEPENFAPYLGEGGEGEGEGVNHEGEGIDNLVLAPTEDDEAPPADGEGESDLDMADGEESVPEATATDGEDLVGLPDPELDPEDGVDIVDLLTPDEEEET